MEGVAHCRPAQRPSVVGRADVEKECPEKEKHGREKKREWEKTAEATRTKRCVKVEIYGKYWKKTDDRKSETEKTLRKKRLKIRCSYCCLKGDSIRSRWV